MSNRLDVYREQKLQPERMKFAQKALSHLGYTVNVSNLDDKPSSITPVQGYEDIYTVNFENGEVAQVEVFPENEGINFHWVKVNADKVTDQVLSDEIESLETEIDGYEHDLRLLNSQNEELRSKNESLLIFINGISGEMLRNDFVLDEKWYDQAQQLIKSATQI